MNAMTDLIIKVHLTAQMLPGNLMARLHDEERGATQTVEVVALAAALIAILIAVAGRSEAISGYVQQALDRLLQAATNDGS